MPNVDTMYDPGAWLRAWELSGADVTLEIESVSAGEVIGEKGRKTKMPVVKFKGRERKLALNKTNKEAIKRLYGKMTEDWVGKSVTLYPTTTERDGVVMECIRIRPFPPKNSKAAQAAEAKP